MNRKNKIIFFSVYFVAAVVTIVKFLKDRDPSTDTILKLLLILFFQLLIFLFIYFGSQKKLIFKPKVEKQASKLSKETRGLKVFLIVSLVFCGFKILEQAFYIYLLLSGGSISNHTNYQTLLDQLMKSEPTVAGSILEIIVGLVSLIGISFIWKMKKIGFYVYVLSEAFFLFNFASQSIECGLLGLIVVGQAMMWPLWDVLFIIMCAGKLKHMTWRLKQAPATN